MKPRPSTMRVLVNTLAEIRRIDEQMPMQMAQALLVIAMRPGLTMQELSEEVGLSQASCSRNVAALAKWHRLHKAGHDLVESMDDPRERRRKVMFLTPKGKRVVEGILHTLDPDAEVPTFNKKDLY